MTHISITGGYDKKLPWIKKIVSSLQKLFVCAPKKISVIVAPDRNRMETMLHRSLMSWEVAVTKQQTIFILDPLTANHPGITSHNFNTLLHHELVHVFYNTLIPEGVPYWLNEGLAYNLARQKFKTFSSVNIAMQALKYYARFDPALYRYGPAMSALLIQYNSLPLLIKKLTIFSRASHRPREFQKIFLDLFKKLPTDLRP